MISTSIVLPEIQEHGWEAYGTIDWVNQPFPDDINELLLVNKDES
jgi:hypothetical protein